MDHFTRVDVTHCDEVTRTATSTLQWFLENLNKTGTHHITHNNYLTFFICGKDAFADIAFQIQHAKSSIDICCWGFDPAMELVRDGRTTWPRGDTYGDLLIAAARRDVRVRLLVWYDGYAVHTDNPGNMPGITHGTHPWRSGGGSTDKAVLALSAAHSLRMLQEYCERIKSNKKGWDEYHPSIRVSRSAIPHDRIPLLAREEYCHSWYDAALNGRLPNIDICTHYAKGSDIASALVAESRSPAGLERAGMVHFGSHHQKPILIDFAHGGGYKACGYVMGLNSVTDYWDTQKHQFEDPSREQGQGKTQSEPGAGKAGFQSLKPLRDYACRIDGGGALVDLHNNFASAWNRVCRDDHLHVPLVSRRIHQDYLPVPPALLRKASDVVRPSTVQIVRTQAAEQDHSIRDIYFQATKNATLATGYMYLENQYFQHEEWAQRLMETRKKVIAGWKKGCAKSGRSVNDMPVMHLFVVIPVPERSQMIPNTYDTLATLGQQDGMTGQAKLIENHNERAKMDKNRAVQQPPTNVLGHRADSRTVTALPEVVQHANGIDKPTSLILQEQFGLKVSTAMLNVSGFVDGGVRYREIYIHSKLMLVDDIFITLGSANLNQRSMAGDSELNLATTDAVHARALRERIWSQLSGGKVTGGDGGRAAIAKSFGDWTNLMKLNRSAKQRGFKMTGFLLPLHDDRSSTIRLG